MAVPHGAFDMRNGKLNQRQRKAEYLQVLRGGKPRAAGAERVPQPAGIGVGEHRHRQIHKPLRHLFRGHAKPAAGYGAPNHGGKAEQPHKHNGGRHSLFRGQRPDGGHRCNSAYQKPVAAVAEDNAEEHKQEQ